MDVSKRCPFIKPVGVAAAILGIVQGLTWSILALLEILLYSKAWKPDILTKPPKTYGGQLSLCIATFIHPDGKKSDDIYIRPQAFFIWNILYLIISIIWVIISLIQLMGLLSSNQKGGKTKAVFFGWGLWTTIICVCDLILASLLAADYDTIVQDLNKHPSFLLTSAVMTPLCVGILMTIAARGFVLWLVNFVFACSIIQLGLKADKIPEVSLNVNNGMGHQPLDRLNTPSRGYSNLGFNWNEEQQHDVQSNRSSKLPSTAGNNNDRLARIGKHGAKSPAHSVAPPKVPLQSYIYPSAPRVPSPDYSPPNTPSQNLPRVVKKSRQQSSYGGYSNDRRY